MTASALPPATPSLCNCSLLRLQLMECQSPMFALSLSGRSRADGVLLVMARARGCRTGLGATAPDRHQEREGPLLSPRYIVTFKVVSRRDTPLPPFVISTTATTVRCCRRHHRRYRHQTTWVTTITSTTAAVGINRSSHRDNRYL